ncbi:yfaZ family protein [Yersinia pestis PY-46]|nr:yfaZ family protein [Yersinia pestis PY-46]
MTSGMKSYSEANGGVRWNVFRPLTVDVGYRYINMEGKEGRRDNRLADGVYIGAGLNF